jgi:ATP-dependent DNA helicase RecG
MDARQLEERLTLGEDSRHEFKGVARNGFTIDAGTLAKAIAAMANTAGGYVILGVEDDGTVTGIGDMKQADALMRKVSDVCLQNVQRSVSCAQHKLQVRGAAVLAVEVPAFSVDRPHFVGGVAYVRDANRSRQATRDELIRIVQSINYHFDEQKVDRATLADIDPTVVLPLLGPGYDARALDAHMTAMLRALKCVDDDGVPTIAGMLLLGREPEHWFPDARITALRFGEGDSLSEFIDRKEIQGRLTDQVRVALEFLDLHVGAPSVIEDHERRELGVPRIAYREAVLNAVMHRDYRIASQIKVFVFDDRIEFVNPGGLLNHLTLDSIRIGGISQRRNPVLASLVGRLAAQRPESVGIGVPEMIRSMRGRGLPDPEFSVEGGHFRVVLRSQPAS